MAADVHKIKLTGLSHPYLSCVRGPTCRSAFVALQPVRRCAELCAEFERCWSPRVMAASQAVVVVKVGTSSLIHPEKATVKVPAIAAVVETVCELQEAGWRVVLVSSGAVGVGCTKLKVKQRPTELAKLQALAAVGQCHLMHLYDSFLSLSGRTAAQVLMSAHVLSDRESHSAATSTLQALLDMPNVIPIVNENDTTAHQELRVGDNDTLSALVASMVHARALVLVTDVDALCTANPSLDPAAVPIRTVPADAITHLRQQLLQGVTPLSLPSSGIDAGAAVSETLSSSDSAPSAAGSGGTQWGTGGMQTKLQSASLAAASGTVTAIVSNAALGSIVSALQDVFGAPGSEFTPLDEVTSRCAAQSFGTWCLPSAASQSRTLNAHKRWVLSLTPMGAVRVDAGAATAVCAKKSLFAAGCKGIAGAWNASVRARVCAVARQGSG